MFYYRKDELVFPPFNSYQRLLLHKIAEYFGFLHMPLDPSNKSVLCIKKAAGSTTTPTHQIPALLLKDFYECDSEVSPNIVETASEVKIMKRSISQNTSSSPALTDPATLRRAFSQTLEEKEAAYRIARERIFNSLPRNSSEFLTEKLDGLPVILKEIVESEGLSRTASAKSNKTEQIPIVITDSELTLNSEEQALGIKSLSGTFDGERLPERSRTLGSKFNKGNVTRFTLEELYVPSPSASLLPTDASSISIANSFSSMTLKSKLDEPDILTFAHMLAVRFKSPKAISDLVPYLSSFLPPGEVLPEVMKAVPLENSCVYIIVFGHQRKAGQVLHLLELSKQITEASLLQMILSKDENKSKTF